MRVRLKGIHKIKAKGHEYYYAWRGGPRLPGKPGDAEFINAYNEAIKLISKAPNDQLQSIIDAYQQSPDFKDLADRTRKDYARLIAIIEAEFSDFPLSALKDPRSRSVFLEWRDQRAQSSRKQADYAMMVLGRIFSWGLNRGTISANPVVNPGRTYRADRRENIWTATDESRFMEVAPLHIRLPFLLALWTGQRQGDILRLPWSAYDGKWLRLRQRKTNKRVQVPVAAALKTVLDSIERISPIIATSSEGRPWTSDGFRASWRKVCLRAGIVGLTFHDLRGTAASRLKQAGATIEEIAEITGHSTNEVHSILEAHYLASNPDLALSGMSKLESKSRTKV